MHENIGELILRIRESNQMQIYTVDTSWCVQLFDIDVCANDLVDCEYENQSFNLEDALRESLEWIRNKSVA